jgi:hypothetical protein
MAELPTVPQGHAPLDSCHRAFSGVAIHVLPGCECEGPVVLDDAGKVVAKGPNHVQIWEKGGTRSVSIDDARAAGLVV